MSIFGVLDIASRGLLINQAGIRTTGHNIANASNPEYSRQRQILRAETPEVLQSGTLGTGVRQLSVERITDQFLFRSLTSEESSSGSTDVQANALAAIEEVFNEQSGGGLSPALTQFYNAFDDLVASTDETGAIEREQILVEANAVIAELQRMDSELRAQQQAVDRSLQNTAAEINDLAVRIQDLNDEIVRAEITAPANDLRDQRDQLVRDLSRRVDINTFEQDDGNLVVMMRANGLPLVEGPSVGTLTTTQDTSNPFDGTFVNVLFDDGANRVDVTASIGGGELGGALAVRDSIIPDAIRSLDTIAYNLVDSVNSLHNAGFALDGSTNVDFFTDLTAVEDAARDISLDAAIDADRIAAADALAPTPATVPFTGNRAVAEQIAGLRSGTITIALPGDPPGPASGPTRSLLDHTAATIADIGQQAATVQEAKAQQDRVLETLQNRRDQISGVSIDEEVVTLVRLQAAFQANARVIATVQQMLDDLVSVV